MGITPITKPDNPRQGPDNVYEEMAQAMRRKAMRDYDEDLQYKERRERGMGNGSTFNGSTKFVNFMLSIMMTLVIAAVVGGVVLYGQVQSLSAKVDILMMRVR